MLEQGVDLGAVVRVKRNADAGRQVELMAVDDHRLGERGEHAVGHERGFLHVRQARQQHDELVAAQTGEQILVAHAARQPARRQREHAVAGRVAERVVHGLEVVEVEKQDG